MGLGIAVVQGVTTPKSAEPPMGNRAYLEPIKPETFTGSQITMTDAIRIHDESVWIDERDSALVVDETPLECHGGRAHIVWHIGNLEPQSSDVGIHLTTRLDGEEIGSILRGTTVDTWGDSPLAIHAVAECPAGEHTLDLLVRSIHGRWGFPYVVNENEPASPDLRVGRGFIVTEVWR
jgi:hypothetical protein